jgi:phosphoglycerol transferase MdoB-like AlkP superfamily enzyme
MRKMFFTYQQLRLLKRGFFLLVIYSILRIGFYFYHLNLYRQFTSDEIFQSFLLGIRFDVAAICLINIPVILLSLIPSKNSKFVTFERVIFVFLNFIGIVAALDDYELFLFMGKRLSFDFFVISEDIWQQLPQVFLYYWYLPVVAIALAIGFYFLDKNWFSPKRRPFRWTDVLSGILVLGVSFIGIRGGLQHKSINVQTAFSQGKNELGHLVLNTPYHFLRTLQNVTVEKVKYFKSDEEAINVILNRRDLRYVRGGDKRNIVLIILESFSNEYMEKGLTPFLSELSKKGISFHYHQANGRRSIEALPSLLCGLASLLDETFSKSLFQGNKFSCMPKILKEHGYRNYFFHGGAKGTMGFESYTLANGFDRYFSKEDYPFSKDFDGTWGIYDGPYLQFAVEEISKMKEPFLAGIFTLSSHQPYAIPRELIGKFPKGSLEIHESIGYTDFALRKFFESAEKKSWFKNTIFVITSDHTQKLETKKYQNSIGRYRVPLIFYSPRSFWENPQRMKVSQHSDIPKTILDLVGVDGEMTATAVSLVSSDKGQALNYADGHEYLLVGLDKSFRMSKAGHQEEFQYDWETGDYGAPAPSEDPLLKAYLQYFMNGLINNNLSIYR